MTARERLILFVLGGGFLMTAIEVRYLHREMLTSVWQSWIPLVVCALCLIASWGLAWRSTERTGLAVLVFVLGTVSGVYGFYLHSDGGVERLAALFSGSGRHEDDGDHEERGLEPPVLAPLSITGLSLIGVVTAARRRRDTVEDAGRGLGTV